ncbi:MAG: Phosphoglucosamine mutase [Methanoregula sp. PtaU1.Bin051]|nr:MAG: Phosphoglucosamine mutase [Methanoregula sp. PtaU1.Bin051]
MKRSKSGGRLFGTNGARGVVGVDMTPELVFSIGAAFGSMRRGKIAVGRDTRTSGEMLLHALKAGLLSTGCDIVDCGVLPTPALQFLVRGEFTGGAMITASHNPPEYNGIKVIDADGTEMGDNETAALERLVRSGEFAIQSWDGTGKETAEPDSVGRYTDAIVARFPGSPGKGMLVAIDTGSGPACRTTPEILRRIGCRVLTVNGTMDGTFPGRQPEPSEQGLAALSALVVGSGADFGIAHDGDADRAVFLDENGRYVEENAELALVARYICRRRKGAIVTPVSTSRLVGMIAEEEGCGVVYTKVGSINVARKMLALIREGKDVVFGGEGNGGLIYPEFQFCRDGGMTAAMMVAILAEEKKKLSAIVASLPRRFMIKGKISAPAGHAVLAALSREFARDTIDRLDGVKIIRGESWALIRESGTEPLVRIVVESPDQEQAASFYKEVTAAVQGSLERKGSRKKR